MSNLDNLIFDRTQEDLINDTDKAYIDYNDLNRVEGACQELAELLGVNIAIKTWQISDYRTVSEMQRLRDNMAKLKEVYYYIPGTPIMPEEITYTSITQANNIEKILFDIYDLYKNVISGSPRLSFNLARKAIGNRR